jgi:hypothetical protein
LMYINSIHSFLRVLIFPNICSFLRALIFQTFVNSCILHAFIASMNALLSIH